VHDRHGHPPEHRVPDVEQEQSDGRREAHDDVRREHQCEIALAQEVDLLQDLQRFLAR
jgi:hypothetical protein